MTFHRQNWREWIAFDLEYPSYVDQKVMIQLRAEFGWLWRFYIPITDDNRATHRMTIAPVAALILAGRGIKRAWFHPARFLYRHGWLAGIVPEKPVHWFWFQYIGKK